MMSRKNRVRQIIKAPVTVMTFIALTGGFRVIKAALDDVCGRTRWTRDAVWPAQIADGLITLHLIDQIFDVDLHRWTPVRGWTWEGISIRHPHMPRPWNPIRASTERHLPRRVELYYPSKPSKVRQLFHDGY